MYIILMHLMLQSWIERYCWTIVKNIIVNWKYQILLEMALVMKLVMYFYDFSFSFEYIVRVK